MGRSNMRPIVINSYYKHELDNRIKEWEAKGYKVISQGKRMTTGRQWGGIISGYFAKLIKEENNGEHQGNNS